MESKKYNKLVNIAKKEADSSVFVSLIYLTYEDKLVVTSGEGGEALKRWDSGWHKLLGVR